MGFVLKRRADESGSEKQMKLVHDELNRARTAATARISSFHTRGAILVSASGLFTALQVSKQVNCLTILSTALFLGSSVIGLLVLRPVLGYEVNPGVAREHWIKLPYAEAQEAIIEANEHVLGTDLGTGNRLSKLILFGYSVLVAAWVLSYVGSVLH
ncbi:hypothetical protein NicSoilC12_24360 [Arthrobacter sp. NicSoilC12]|nr:hypothetical protein NicSoilC12_24360 [Arthrobacter sp. NicSoilC12]